MKSWHRDAMAGAGAVCLLIAAFLVSLVLGFTVTGMGLIALAFELAPKGDSPTDGS